MSSGAMMRPCRASLVGYDGSDGAKPALDRAVVEARDRHVRTAVVSVASMPLDLDAPRHYGTLDDISRAEGGDRSRRRPRSSRTSRKRGGSSRPPAWTRSSLRPPVSRPTRSSRWRGASDPLCRVPPFNRGVLWSATCVLKPKSCSAQDVGDSSWGQVVGGAVPPEATKKAICWPL
jgi:hypothetical protein